MSGDLVIPGERERPRSGELLDAAGRTLTRWERLQATRVRIMRLDDDGQPTGEATEVGAGEVLTRYPPRPPDASPCYSGPVDQLTRRTITVRFYEPVTGDRARGAHWLL